MRDTYISKVQPQKVISFLGLGTGKSYMFMQISWVKNAKNILKDDHPTP
jgi:hypothetical protein